LFSRAARAVWGDMIQEHFNVDSSGDMNDLASLLLRDGNEEMEMPIKGVFYRQFLPASHTVCVLLFTLQFHIQPNCIQEWKHLLQFKLIVAVQNLIIIYSEEG